jgi:hypothetical protein
MPVPDMDKLNAFIGQFVTDLGASVHAGMVVIGEKLGLYKALAAGPMTPAELAEETATDERYLREWLASQAAGGYITYDETTKRFSLTNEQAFALAHEDSPAYLPGAFELAVGSLAAVHRGVIPHGRRNGLARTRSRRFSRLRKVLPSRLRCEPCQLVDTFAKPGSTKAGNGCPGGRHRLRKRRIDGADGKSFPQLAIFRI